eukprot:UN05790
MICFGSFSHETYFNQVIFNSVQFFGIPISVFSQTLECLENLADHNHERLVFNFEIPENTSVQ